MALLPFTLPADLPVTSALTASQAQEIDMLFPSPTQQSQSLLPSPQCAPSRQRAPSQQPSTVIQRTLHVEVSHASSSTCGSIALISHSALLPQR
ncbi:hypothetical protein BDW22DRAFT_1433206 [Trametopsis cervina]|nr:hypothetical protein BDW22DRAFT_1433206 [Trametopsis cervina]